MQYQAMVKAMSSMVFTKDSLAWSPNLFSLFTDRKSLETLTVTSSNQRCLIERSVISTK